MRNFRCRLIKVKLFLSFSMKFIRWLISVFLKSDFEYLFFNFRNSSIKGSRIVCCGRICVSVGACCCSMVDLLCDSSVRL